MEKIKIYIEKSEGICTSCGKRGFEIMAWDNGSPYYETSYLFFCPNCFRTGEEDNEMDSQKKLEIKNFEDWQAEERIAEKKLALEMQERRPIDILSTEFADWQTAVETSRFGNDHEFLEICYAGVERLANRIEVE